MPRQAQVKGKKTGTQWGAQEQRRDSLTEDEKTKNERPKHHTVRANKYGLAGLKPGHSDISANSAKCLHGSCPDKYPVCFCI